MTPRGIPAEPPAHAPAWVKAAWVDRVLDATGDDLHRELEDLVAAAGRASRAARLAKSAAGLGKICERCEREEEGSCCGAGIEDRIDSRYLLANCLLGAEIPALRFDGRSCLFLGEGGCSLAVPPLLCVNYVCEKLVRAVQTTQLAKVREAEGREAEAIFWLHERLGERLRAMTSSEGEAELDARVRRQILASMTRFCDAQKHGTCGPGGTHRSTDLKTLALGCEDLAASGLIDPARSAFFDAGCADGRVSLLASVFFARHVRE